jgi:hypothetical protein
VLPRLFVNQRPCGLIESSQLLLALGVAPIALDDGLPCLPSTVPLDESHKTKADCVGASGGYSVLYEGVDLSKQTIVHSCNQLCHASSIAERYAGSGLKVVTLPEELHLLSPVSPAWHRAHSGHHRMVGRYSDSS